MGVGPGYSRNATGWTTPSLFIEANRPRYGTRGIGGGGPTQTPAIVKLMDSTTAKIDKTAAGAESKIAKSVAKARKRFDKMIAKGASESDIQAAVQKSLDSLAVLVMKSDAGIRKAVRAAESKLAKLEMKDGTLTQEADAALDAIDAHAEEKSLELMDLFDMIEMELGEAYP